MTSSVLGDRDEYTRVYVSGLPLKCKESDVRSHFESLGGEVTDVSFPQKKNGARRGIAFVGFKDSAMARHAVDKLDRTFVGSSRLGVRRASSMKESPAPPSAKESEKANKKRKESEKAKKTKREEFFELMTGEKSTARVDEEEKSAAFDSGLDDLSYLKTKTRKVEESAPATVGERVLVSNLPEAATEEDVLSYFEGRYGKVSEVHIPKRGKRMAFVRYVLPESSEKTLLSGQAHVFQGRVLRVIAAEEEEREEYAHQRKKPRTFSERREAERKAKALHEVSRLSGYVREDAVASAAAKRLGSSKADIFDAKAQGAAVALTLAESQTQAETASFLAEAGYDLASKQKSRKALLVKNIAEATQAEMRNLFVDCSDVIVVPSRTAAIVEFEHPVDARTALKRNAYRRFKHLPLYIDWAPEKTKKDSLKKSEEPLKEVDDEARLPTSCSTVFVKNINFKTTGLALREKFKHLKPRSVSLPPSTKGGNKGFGFIEFSTPWEAQRAVDAISGISVDAHRLEASLSEKIAQTTKKKVGASAKIVVRNLAFAATVHDVRELFAAFGQVETVRIPKRFDGRHRGFAFVRFAARRDAAAALAALKDAHLYGRHLVIEFANEEEDEKDAA